MVKGTFCNTGPAHKFEVNMKEGEKVRDEDESLFLRPSDSPGDGDDEHGEHDEQDDELLRPQHQLARPHLHIY